MRRPIPHLGAPDSDVISYVKQVCNPELGHRKVVIRRMTRSLLYYLGHQWLDDMSDVITGSDGYFFYRSSFFEDSSALQPVTNYTAVACDNEHSRIAKKEWEFTVIADDASPEVRAAATVGKHVLKDKLRRQHWDEQRPTTIMDSIICGTSALYSGWEESLLNTIDQPSPLACCCPQCSARLAAPTAPAEFRAQISSPNAIGKLSADVSTLSLNGCPFCGSPLESMNLSLDEAMGMGPDAFGRPLVYTVPKGDPIVRVISPFELFPENGGVYVDPHAMRVCGWARPESLQWVLEHAPHKVGQIEPTNPAEIIKYHPLYGEYAELIEHVVGEEGILDNHCMVNAVIVEPFAEQLTESAIEDWKMWADTNGESYDNQAGAGDIIVNHGRYYLTIGDQVICHKTLLVPYESKDKTAYVPRVRISASRYLYRRSEFWGKSLVEDIIPLQDRLNQFDQQHLEVFTRMGNPHYMLPADMELRGPEYRDNSKVPVWSYERSDYNANDKPEVLQGEMLPGAAWNYRNTLMADLQNISSLKDVELGDAPQRVRTTSALVLVGEQANARRMPREAGLGIMCESMASHVLHMLYALRTDDDTYQIDAKGASLYSIQSFRGADLMAQYNVRLERQAGVDDSILLRESAFEALQAGLYPTIQTNPVAYRNFMEMAGLKVIDDMANCQVTIAEKACVDFIEKGKVHRPDPTVEDPATFYEVMGKFWLENDTLIVMRDAVKWEDRILPAIAGWEVDLIPLEAKAKLAKEYYQDIPPEEARQLFEDGIESAKAVMAEYQQAAQAAIAQHIEPPPPPQVQPPPQPVYLPNALEDKVMLMYNQRLGLPTIDPGVSLSPSGVTGVLDKLLQFSAVIQAYRLYAERKAMAAMPSPGQQQGLPSPGGPQ